MKNPPVNGETRPNGKRRSPIVAPGRNVHSSSRRCRTGRVRPQSHESIGKDARRRRRLSLGKFLPSTALFVYRGAFTTDEGSITTSGFSEARSNSFFLAKFK